jgi:hypothetical protein
MRRFINLAAIAAALSICGSAAAQGTNRDYTPSNFSFRIGGAFPIDDNLSDLGNSLFAAGIDYRIDRPFFPNGETFFSVDWFGRTTSGTKGNVFPVNINHKWFTNPLPTSEDRRSYFFAGVGAVFIDVASAADTVLGARAGVGLELGPYFFAEGAFYISDKSGGNVRSTAAAVYLGYRF